jgi:hypothetical protein
MRGRAVHTAADSQDLVMFALIIDRSLATFGSALGIWIVFGWIFLSTSVVSHSPVGNRCW